ncbi:hypothetical protein FGIG_05633 [Fasciola gigantica]|uniref:DUF1308 domain-containing protein n=1 Tax=Fasciola gigantica TaxID=46835 RepID=A0A504YD94_FASGI|nr:hypothetical protein FGIG_05633 [Fasciola gigantica]
MVSESRGLAVMEELKSLIREVRDSMKLIPGSDRLLRACSKELHHFAKLPPSRLDNAASCSNLPHFRAIAKLGQAYGDRVTGMMCRFRMPPSSGRVQNSVSRSENLFEVLEGGSDLLTPRYKKTESVLVDLVCIQHPREPIICPGFCSPSEQGESESESESGRKRQQQQSCPGNASDADCWAPSLWIKVVTRDASRLNAAWLGEASSSRAACLYRQMKELVATASWYQRGQPANWIRAVIHWIPQSNADATTALDPGLLDALTQLNVYLLPHSRPWFAATHSTPLQPEVTNNDSLQNRTTLSLQKHMANLGIFRRALLSVWTKPTDLESRCDSVSLLESALRDALSRRSSNGYFEDLKLDAQLTNLAVLDAVLHLSVRPPFSHEVLNSLDSHHRVNLDVSAMVALASELSQFLPDRSIVSSHDPSLVLGALESPQRRENLIKQPRFKCNTLGWLLESEAERPVLTAIHQHIRGAVVIVCRTAALSFLRILVTVAGEREWFRGLYLLSQAILVPDLVFSDSPSVAANKENPRPTHSNRRKTQLIMDVGNAFGALTITANEAFLRSLRNKGLKHVALLVPARALTETAARDDL